VEKIQKENLLKILKLARIAIKKGDVKTLRNLSDWTVHDASIYQSDIYVLVAVIIYSLSKIYSRENYETYKSYHLYCEDCTGSLEKARVFLEKDDIVSFENQLKSFLDKINKLDKKFKFHVKDIFERAKIHKASRLHEHGISLGRTAEFLGISQFELMNYVGTTGISDVKENITLSVKERLNNVRNVFK